MRKGLLILMTKPIKDFFCILWAVILTAGAITFVFGAVPMHVSWRTLGRRIVLFMLYKFVSTGYETGVC